MVKDLVGRPSDDLELPAGASLQQVFDHYSSQTPRLAEFSKSIVLARNQSFVPRTEALDDGDEIAFLPPVSGGASNVPPAGAGSPHLPFPSKNDHRGPYTHVIEDPAGHFFALTRQPVDAASLARQILRGEDGAFVDFEGVVRNNTKGRAAKFLDYECYEAMAIKMMAEIGSEIAGRHAIGRIAIVHRLGRLQIGETSVAVVVTAPHRRPAFEAALEGIDRLKKTVPIWKKEHFADGEVWVEGEWDDKVLRQS
jgi:molybdopterin synthase catalytic subunit